MQYVEPSIFEEFEQTYASTTFRPLESRIQDNSALVLQYEFQASEDVEHENMFFFRELFLNYDWVIVQFDFLLPSQHATIEER